MTQTIHLPARDPLPVSLYDLTREQLERQLAEWGEPAFRARQIRSWLYQRFAADYDDMSDLAKPLRARLKEHYALGRVVPAAERQSTDGWTRKWLLRLSDGSDIETVLMEYDGERRTACISSQAGCAMNCSFCATGQMGFLRNLRSGEIVEQVVFVARALQRQAERSRAGRRDETPEPHLTNVVLMGMGEPFANYGNVMEAVARLVEPRETGGYGLGSRKITISTVGIVPGIARFAEQGSQVNLAVSLHAATDDLRSRLVPINDTYPLHELGRAIRGYIDKTNRRVSLEWALIDGVNDTVEQAHALVAFVRSVFDPRELGRNMLHVNMIPLNPTDGYGGSASHRVPAHKFSQVLTEAGIPNTMRTRRGIDISAGCGQLKSEADKAYRRG